MSLGNALLSRNLPAQIPDFAESSEMEAFRRRQQMDIVRKRQTYGAQSGSDEEKGSDHEAPAIDTGGPWRNPDGERLAGFGVDEDVDRPKEDDRPLSTLIRRKKRP